MDPKTKIRKHYEKMMLDATRVAPLLETKRLMIWPSTVEANRWYCSIKDDGDIREPTIALGTGGSPGEALANAEVTMKRMFAQQFAMIEGIFHPPAANDNQEQ